MLRRYSSRNLETIPIQSKVLTIGTDKCDIKLNAKGVHPIHASIEQNPKSGSFWLRDHSLAGHTSVNGHTVNGQVELHNGDLVRIGKAQPYVFEKRVVLPLVSSNTSNDDLGSNSSLEVGLPILGKRISPLPPQPKSRRPLTAVAKFRRNVNNNGGNEKGSVLNEDVGTISPPSSMETCSESSVRSGIKRTIHNRGSVGNHLLQRVIRLQDEVARKNAEQLSKSLPPVVNSYNNRNFELEAYRAFLAAVATKVRSFNNL
ncbi:unnamed protein product [Cylicocyclus nassatus]|uniref:FHA domain-containing protein n=1 Tax=Cylicocyclus nassatus TaxID=53992 RepID=A0AA36HAD5_CYLNA|nr:unnamed protein product [Cylicocyclus nassatus]